MADVLNAILYSKFLAEPKCRESKRGHGTSSTQVMLEIGSAALMGHQRISKGTAMTLCLAQAARQAPPGAALSLRRGPIARESCIRGRKKRSRAFGCFHTVRNISVRKQCQSLLGKETATCIVLPINAGICCAPRGHVLFHSLVRPLPSVLHLFCCFPQTHPNCRFMNQCVLSVKKSLASLATHSINRLLCCSSPVEQWPCEGKKSFTPKKY